MGREVRMVPADWQHPTNNGRVVPLHAVEDYQPRLDSWNANVAERGIQGAIEWDGGPPDRKDYMPDWPVDQRTHCMMYETTSEGTPISPAFATPEELARWLTDNNASAFGRAGASYEGWLRVCKGGYAFSAVMIDGKMTSGVDGLS